MVAFHVQLYAARHNVSCWVGTEIEKKPRLTWLSFPSSVDPPPYLYHSGSLWRSVHAPLLWSKLGLPWGVWVLQHKTVNPPESWWLLIRYSHPASCLGENSSGLDSLSLPHHPPLLIHSCTSTSVPSRRYDSIQYIMQGTGTTSPFFFLSLPSAQQTSRLCLCLFGSMTLLPSLCLSLTLCLLLFHLSVIFSLSLCLTSSLSPCLTCHSRPVSLGRNEYCSCNYHPLWECGSTLWLCVISDHDNVCRWAWSCEYESSVPPQWKA